MVPTTSWVVNKLYLSVWVNKLLFSLIIGKNINICGTPLYLGAGIYVYVVYDLFMGTQIFELIYLSFKVL